MDDRLNQLAKEAQQYPDRSYERRRALNKLAQQILQSGKVIRPRNDSLPPAVYEELYREALNITLMEICNKIDDYKPEQPLMVWFNFILGKRFIDCCRKWKFLDRNNLPLDLAALDRHLLDGEDSNYNFEDLKKFIEEDPDQLFTQKHVKGNPKATFQFLVLARIWEDRKWKDISAELQVPNATLCEFFKKQLKELTPYFRDYLIN